MDKLVKGYKLKFDALSQKYVVAKDEEMEEGRDRFVQVQENQVPTTPTPATPIQTPPQVVTPTPVVEPTPAPTPSLPESDVVCLVAQLYNNTRILDMMYQQMRNISRDNASTIERLMRENSLVQTPLLNIYFSLSGENVRPRQNLTVPILGNNFCEGLVVVSDYLMDMIAKNLELQRSINVTEIDRQLSIIGASFTSQKDTIDDLRREC